MKFVKSIWTQVAKYFKDYDQHLVFETLNEPRLVGTGDEWSFPVNNPNSAVRDSISVINTLIRLRSTLSVRLAVKILTDV